MVGQFVHMKATEDADGIRTTFHVPEPHADGTLQLCVNGRSFLDGWTITDGLTVELEEAPYEGDVISFWYRQV